MNFTTPSNIEMDQSDLAVPKAHPRKSIHFG